MKYKIELCHDNEYAVYDNESDNFDYVFKGTLEEVNAWISLQAEEIKKMAYRKGYMDAQQMIADEE